MSWPTTKGLAPALPEDKVRDYVARDVAAGWGRRVEERMTALGLRNVQLAKLSDTTPQTVLKIRRGELVPRDSLKIAIAAALGTAPADLFPLPDPREVEAAISRTVRPRKTKRVA